MKYRYTFLFLLFSFFIQAQTLKSYEKAATKAIAEEDYNAALLYLSKALAIEPEAPNLQFQYALIAYRFQSFEASSDFFGKVIENKEILNYSAAYFWQGMAQKSLGKYAEAEANFRAFINAKANGKDPQLLERAKAEIKACAWAAQQNLDEKWKVEQLNKRINSTYSEFAPLQQGDTLFYSSYRYENKNDDHTPNRRITKVLLSKKGAKGRPLPRGFNLKEKQTAHLTFSTKGDRVYFTICDYVGTAKIRCDLYYREKDRRGRWKKSVEKLPEPVNMAGFTSTQPAIGFDSLSKTEVLFFTSNRPNGNGNLDIWFCEIDEENKLKAPQNLSAINTNQDELTPFFHTTSQTLYFSSNGHQNLGGYDIFKTHKDSTQNGVIWRRPQHLPAPINTSYNDLYYSLNADGKTAHIASNRPGSFYLDAANKSCCNDIFRITEIPPVEVIPDKPITTIPDVPKPIPSPPKPFVPETLEDFLPLALYFDNDEPDKRTRRTTTKKNYEETYLRYYDRKPEYMREYIAPLDEEQAYEAEIIMDEFFEDNVRLGYEHLTLFSEILLKRLTAGEKVEIFVKGFTSPRAKSDYNLSLGKRRISSVRNQFAAYRDGIFQPYLENGQLTITERSFGETTADTTISDDLEDLRGSVYSVDAAKERRVEIVEIKRE